MMSLCHEGSGYAGFADNEARQNPVNSEEA